MQSVVKGRVGRSKAGETGEEEIEGKLDIGERKGQEGKGRESMEKLWLCFLSPMTPVCPSSHPHLHV